MKPVGLGLALGALATVLAAGCATIFGMEEGEPVTTAGGGGGGGGGTGGTTSGTGGEGAGSGGGLCDPSSCPGEDADCQQRACVNNQCDLVIEATGTACDDYGGHYCDGAGHCVVCLTNDHCAGLCQDNQCVDASCDDNAMNNGESDVDCGGPCGACANGFSCFSSDDCLSLVCMSLMCVGCTAHQDCPVVGNWYCESGMCHPQKEFGDSCVEDYECNTGWCSYWPITGWMCSFTDN